MTNSDRTRSDRIESLLTYLDIYIRQIDACLTIVRDTYPDGSTYLYSLLDAVGYALRLQDDLERLGTPIPAAAARILESADRWLKEHPEDITSILKNVSLDALKEELGAWIADYEAGLLDTYEETSRFGSILNSIVGFCARLEALGRYSSGTAMPILQTLRENLDRVIETAGNMAADDPDLSELVRDLSVITPGGPDLLPWSILLPRCDDALHRLVLAEDIARRQKSGKLTFLMPDRPPVAMAASGRRKKVFPERRITLFSEKDTHIELAMIDNVLAVCTCSENLGDIPEPDITRNGEPIKTKRKDFPFEVRFYFDLPEGISLPTTLTIRLGTLMPAVDIRILPEKDIHRKNES